MNDNDILKYVKHDYNDIKDIILFLANPDNITRSSLTELFSNKAAKQDPATGEIVVTPPKYRVTDYFDLPAGILPNQKTEIKDTTIGIFIFNSFIIANAFGKKIQYINKPIDKKNFGKLSEYISNLIFKKVITVQEFATFCNTMTWMGYQTELFMPGMSTELIIPNKEISDLKKELIKQNPKLGERRLLNNVEVSEYLTKIEDPLLEKAEELRQNNYAGRLYDLKKPSFGNNFKNNNLTVGPLADPATGQYKADVNSFNDGINDWNFDILANKAMVGSYCRGVNTQKGGTYAKYVGIMMQTVVTGEPGSDCGTKQYLNFKVTPETEKIIEYIYALIDGKEIMLNEDIIKAKMGKVIQIRSPIFCKSKNCLCNKCIGERPYIMGIKNLGLTGNIPFDKQKNRSMKAFHDVSLKKYSVNVKEFMTFEK